MRRTVISLCSLLLLVAVCVPANGAIIFGDNFNAYNAGTGALNFSAFGGTWTVTSGTVDLIGNGYYDFLPGNGLYLDMDGSTMTPGTILSLSIPLSPGAYVLSYDLAGNHRGGNDTVTASVQTGFTSNIVTLASSTPFTTYSDSFTVSSSQSVQIRFAASAPGNNIGLLLDNVRLESVVPEPATILIWSLFGAGSLFGMRVWRRRGPAGREPWSPEARQAIQDLIARNVGH